MDIIFITLLYIFMISIYLAGMFFLDRKFYESSPRNFLMSILYYAAGWLFRMMMLIHFACYSAREFISNRILKWIRLV